MPRSQRATARLIAMPHSTVRSCTRREIPPERLHHTPSVAGTLLPVLLALASTFGGACSLLDVDDLSAGSGQTTSASAVASTSTSSGGATSSQVSSGGEGGAAPGSGGATSASGGGAPQTSSAGGGPGGEGGGCTLLSYERAVDASAPIFRFGFEETEGTDVVDSVTGETGFYNLPTTPPGEGGPVELGVPGIVDPGLAVRLPATAGALELDVSPARVYGVVFEPHPFSIELWLDAPDALRGPILSQFVAQDGAGWIRLSVVAPQPGDVRPSLELRVQPPGDAAGQIVGQVPVTGLASLHVVVVVAQAPDGEVGCQDRESLALYLGGDRVGVEPEPICALATPDQATARMRIPGDGPVAPSTPFVLDELTFYDRALSDAEVRAHALAGRGDCQD